MVWARISGVLLLCSRRDAHFWALGLSEPRCRLKLLRFCLSSFLRLPVTHSISTNNICQSAISACSSRFPTTLSLPRWWAAMPDRAQSIHELLNYPSTDGTHPCPHIWHPEYLYITDNLPVADLWIEGTLQDLSKYSAHTQVE